MVSCSKTFYHELYLLPSMEGSVALGGLQPLRCNSHVLTKPRMGVSRCLNSPFTTCYTLWMKIKMSKSIRDHGAEGIASWRLLSLGSVEQ